MIEVGGSREQAWVVERGHLASAFGSGLVDVLATPVLVGFCEECARRLVEPHLATGQKTVGASISLDHLAATPPGMTVTVRATLVEVEGRRLTFEIEARDEVEPVARARHVRYIIDAPRFEARVAEKAAQARTVGAAQTRTVPQTDDVRRAQPQTDGVRAASAHGGPRAQPKTDGVRAASAHGGPRARPRTDAVRWAEGAAANGRCAGRKRVRSAPDRLGRLRRSGPRLRRNQHGATIASSHAIHSRRAF